MMDSGELKEFGLSKNEAKIYLFLLKAGPVTTGPIIKETGIANSRVYESLNSLTAKGLAGYTVQKAGKFFNASSPQALLDRENERRKKLESMIPHLAGMQKSKRLKTSTMVFEGFQGFKAAFSRIIQDCPENGTIKILGFSEIQENSSQLRDFIKKMNAKSSAKKQRLEIILGETVRKTFGKDRKKEKFTTVKYLPEEFLSPAGIDVFGDFVYIFLWEEKPFVFMIRNEKISKSFEQYFKMLWKIAKQ